MTTYNETQRERPDTQSPPGSKENKPADRTNVGGTERIGSAVAGALLTLVGLRRRSIPGLALAALGGALIQRGAIGQCSFYKAIGVDTSDESHRGHTENLARSGIHIEDAMTIDRPAQELYEYWRNFENLARIMTHVKSVQVLDNRRSHWVVDAPVVAGGSVEWDARITDDEPNHRIAWRAEDGAAVDSAGEVLFRKALGDRGTEVHVYLRYLPPGGKLGHWIATAFGKSPRRQIREDLRNFKRIMEVGELVTTEGQPRGSCFGTGGSRSNQSTH
ncbi:MAG TPA: SRPBCC family protein [Tepidisphaeraceae bacterium]|jgi:uncharacterized membrane protein|nr:SRPBCC family protein [Tepidisphaeraceae bacterium]